MYSIIFLIFFIILISFTKKYKYIKLYTILYCLLYFMFNILNNNKYDYFTQSFTIVIPFICIICSLWIINTNIYRIKTFCISLILFCFFATSAFIHDNIFFIYSYIEMSLIPMSIMLLSYNKDYDLKIIYKYLFYTLISAIFILIGLINIYNSTNSVLLSDIYIIGIKNKLSLYMLAIGISIKLPIFPFYYWVPSVHGKSPGICSVLLSSIILKFSSLILVKIIVPLFSIYNYKYIWYLVSIGILIASFQVLHNKNLKVIVAYSSVIHMGLYTFILFAGNDIKYFTYSILQHTFTMALLFLILDLLKSNYKCLDFNKIIVNRKYEIVLLTISTLIIIGFPFTWGFISETISILSAVQYNIIVTSIIGLSILLYDSYLIYIFFTIFKNSKINNKNKLDKLYIIIISLLITIIILLGTIPKIYL